MKVSPPDAGVPTAPSIGAGGLLDLQAKITDAELRLGTIQTNLRLLASTWLLASLGGIGFAITSPDLTDPLSGRIAGFVGMAGCIGVLLLWVLDMRVYQRLLGANFNEGLALEAAFPWLPQVRTRIRASFRGRLTMIVSAYYWAMASLLWGVGVVSLMVPRSSGLWPLPVDALILSTGGALLIGAIIYRIETAGRNLGGTPLTTAPEHDARISAYRSLRVIAVPDGKDGRGTE